MVPGWLRWCRVSREAGYSRCRNVEACSFTFGFGTFPEGVTLEHAGLRTNDSIWRAGPLYRQVRGVVNQQRQFVLSRFTTKLPQKSVVRFFDRLDEL